MTARRLVNVSYLCISSKYSIIYDRCPGMSYLRLGFISLDVCKSRNVAMVFAWLSKLAFEVIQAGDKISVAMNSIE